MLAEIIRVELREVWKNETSDFSKWLSKSDNLKKISSLIGLDLQLIETEASFNRFRVDILAKDRTSNNLVIIENQLEETDHKHLGQVITYISHFNPQYLVWIVKDLRKDHEKAISWLSDHLEKSVNVFLLKVDLFKIDNSRPAPFFSVILKPKNWQKGNLYYIETANENKDESKTIANITLEQEVVTPVIVDFLDNFIELGMVYTKKTDHLYTGIFTAFEKMHPSKSSFYSPYKFKSDLIKWANARGYYLNRRKCKDGGPKHAMWKSNGREFFCFEK